MNFDYAVTATTNFATGPVSMRMAIYRVPTNCSGTKTLNITLQINNGLGFQTIATTTQTITVPTGGGIVPVFTINGLNVTQPFSVNNGDTIRLTITPTAGGKLCLVNEYPTGATDQDASHIVLQTAPTLSVTKTSQVVSDPVNGTANPKRIPGARIRYTLQITNAVGASGSGESVTLNDAVPANTTYVPNSITLDGTAQTDAIDGDSGSFGTNTVQVQLGTMAPGTSHTVTYDVTVN